MVCLIRRQHNSSISDTALYHTIHYWTEGDSVRHYIGNWSELTFLLVFNTETPVCTSAEVAQCAEEGKFTFLSNSDEAFSDDFFVSNTDKLLSDDML